MTILRNYNKNFIVWKFNNYYIIVNENNRKCNNIPGISWNCAYVISVENFPSSFLGIWAPCHCSMIFQEVRGTFVLSSVWEIVDLAFSCCILTCIFFSIILWVFWSLKIVMANTVKRQQLWREKFCQVVVWWLLSPSSLKAKSNNKLLVLVFSWKDHMQL